MTGESGHCTWSIQELVGEVDVSFYLPLTGQYVGARIDWDHYDFSPGNPLRIGPVIDASGGWTYVFIEKGSHRVLRIETTTPRQRQLHSLVAGLDVQDADE